MPADALPDPSFFRCRLQDLAAETIRPDWQLAEHALTAEDPVRVRTERTDDTPCDQSFNGNLIQRHRLLRDLSLAWPDAAIDIRTKDIRRFLDEIDVLPLEAQHFTNAKAGGGADGSDRSLAVGKDRKERTELFCREYLWNALSFGADPHESDRILMLSDPSPADCVTEDGAHQVSNLGTTRRSK